MKRRKAWGLLLSLVLLLSAAVPGTLATETPAPTETSAPTEAPTESAPPETQPSGETDPTVGETNPEESVPPTEENPANDLPPVLTIAVNGADSGDTFLFDISKGGAAVTTVLVSGNGSVTVSGLTAGETCTVTPRNSWSWRYGSVAAQTGNPGSTLTFTFTKTAGKQYLLSGSAYGKIGGAN